MSSHSYPHHPFICAVVTVFILCTIPAIIIFAGNRGNKVLTSTRVVFVTATNRSTTRLADLTSLANTLRHEEDIYWIVVDNETAKSLTLDNVIQKAKVPYTFLVQDDFNSEWKLRNRALDFIQNNSEMLLGRYKKAVVYFGDGDYAYDTRFWNNFVKKVNKLGIWDVGRVYDRQTWKKESKEFRYFDLANFAVNMNLITQSNIAFNEKCNLTAVELCFIKDLALKKSDVQQFQNEAPYDYLLWHSPRDDPNLLPGFDLYNYVFPK